MSTKELNEQIDKMYDRQFELENEVTNRDSDIALLRHENAELKAKLDRATRDGSRWQCSCGGTDCAGMKENAELREKLEGQKSLCDELENLNTGHCQELAAPREDRARLDWVLENCTIVVHDFTTGNRDVFTIGSSRSAIDAARKEGAS